MNCPNCNQKLMEVESDHESMTLNCWCGYVTYIISPPKEES